MKDLLVDNTVAKNFCNPLDPEYKLLVKWLFEEGVLVVTQRLLVEYIATAGTSGSNTSMPAVIDYLTRVGRLARFGKRELADFRIPPRVARRLRSNPEDHDSVKAVMLSVRKFALSHDDAFRHDVNNFPGFAAVAAIRPCDIPYSS